MRPRYLASLLVIFGVATSRAQEPQISQMTQMKFLSVQSVESVVAL